MYNLVECALRDELHASQWEKKDKCISQPACSHHLKGRLIMDEIIISLILF